MITIFDTPIHERTCLNCVRYLLVDEWSGVCERHKTEQRPNDSCDRWDGE